MSAQPVEQRVVDPLAPGWVPPVEPVRHLLPVPPPVPDAVTAAVRALVPAPRVAPPPPVAPVETVAEPVPVPAPRSAADEAELRHAALAALRDLARD